MRRDLKKSIRLRILLCMITAVLTLVCMAAVVSAEEDNSAPADDAAPAVSDVVQDVAPPAQPATVQYTAVVVDATTGAAISNAKASLSGISAKGQTYGNEIYFTVPAGSDIRATVRADGYYPTQGASYLSVTSDVVETISLERNPLTNTDPTGVSNDATATDISQIGTATDIQASPEPSAAPSPDPSATPNPDPSAEQGSTDTNLPETTPPAESAPPSDVPSTYTDQPVNTTPTDMTSPGNSLDQQNQDVEAGTPVNESGVLPDVPPAWAESGQPYIKGNLGMAEELRLLQSALDERVATVRAAFDADANVQMSYDADNMADIWAIYAIKSGMTDNYPYNVEFQTQEQSDILQSVFWDMTNVTATVQVVGGERSCVIHVERKTYADVQDAYGLTDQTDQLAALTTSDMRNTVSSQLSDSILSKLSDDEFQAVEQQLQGITGERRDVVLAALSLEGKVNYFWGGKSYHVGWDDRWGEDRLVTADGASQTGTVRPFGLDCSGFVSWAFINAGGDQNIINYIGNGTSMQWYNSKAISMSQLQPGDLLFYKPPGGTGIDHVGIYIGDGKVVHCTTNGDNVVVTGLGKFAYARVPYIYGND